MESCMREAYYNPMENTRATKLFSAKRIAAHQERAIRCAKPDADFLVGIAAEMLGERLGAITREFEVAVDIFSPFGGMAKELANAKQVNRSIRLVQDTVQDLGGGNSGNIIAEFGTIPFEPGSLNLVTSLFALHHCVDLPGRFAEIRNTLAPDGAFLAVLPGDKTLRELRQSLIEAESELTGTASLRIDPIGEVRQYGALLQNAGFALPVVDTEQFTLRYRSLPDLVDDLRAMGATSALTRYARSTPRNLFRRTEELLLQNHADEDGKFRITAEMVFLSGWAPHASQQQPLKPGSADNLLEDFL